MSVVGEKGAESPAFQWIGNRSPERQSAGVILMRTIVIPSALPKASVLLAQPLVNFKRQFGGMRVLIDNQGVSDQELARTLALISEIEAGAAFPRIVAFGGEAVPAALTSWLPPHNTMPELHGNWLALTAVSDMLAAAKYPPWCVGGLPAATLDPAMQLSLRYLVLNVVPGPPIPCPALIGKARVGTRIHSYADADAWFAKGNKWVAGWPLKAPTAPANARRTESRAIVLRLLQLLQANADIGDLEVLLEQDVSLAFKLLRFINSAANGLSLQVQSLRHAVMVLGYQRLNRWLSLLLLASNEDPNLLPVMGISLRRAFFLERIGKPLFSDVDPDELFITGLFSLLDVIFSQSFDELLEKIHLPDAVSDSLRNHTDPYGSLLRLAQAIEGDDATAVRDAINVLGLVEADVNRALLLAIRDAEQLSLDA